MFYEKFTFPIDIFFTPKKKRVCYATLNDFFFASANIYFMEMKMSRKTLKYWIGKMICIF